jgi:hypothetical protein
MLPLLHVAKVNKGLLSALPENQDPGNEVATTDSQLCSQATACRRVDFNSNTLSGLCHWPTTPHPTTIVLKEVKDCSITDSLFQPPSGRFSLNVPIPNMQLLQCLRPKSRFRTIV